MQKNIIIAVLVLVVGFGVGYGFGVAKSSVVTKPIGAGTHTISSDQMVNDGNMSDTMASMNQGLLGKMGDEFDSAFLAEMTIHHMGAIEMATLALKNAKHQEIKDLANGIISAQKKEIIEMKAWQKSWYGR